MFRRFALVLVLALVTASAASADPAPPTVTLLSPANGTSVSLDGKHTPTFSWRIDFPQPQTTATMVFFTVSTDPTFLGPHYTESRTCDAATPACFTSTTPQGTGWVNEAAGGPPPGAGPVTLYWRVSVTWAPGQAPATSAPGTIVGSGSAPDTVAPRVSVHGTTARRGTRAKVRFQLSDDHGTVTANARLLYHGTLLLSVLHTFTQVAWANSYVFWFDLPKRGVPAGRYTACVRATDPAGNASQSCANVTVR